MAGRHRPKPARRQANGGPSAGKAAAPKKRRPSPIKAKRPSVAGAALSDHKLYRAEMLLNISREVAGIESLDAVLEKLVEMTSRETRCERATLFLNDEQTGELYSRVAQGENRREIRLLNTSGIAGHVFTTGEGLIIDDAYSDPRFNAAIDKQTGFETKSIMCVPGTHGEGRRSSASRRR